jgi:hypothetical protein
MNTDTIKLQNHYDMGHWKLSVILYVIFLSLMISLLLGLAHNVIAYIVGGIVLLFLFYMIFIEEMRRTPTFVDIGQAGIGLEFKMRGHLQINWTELTGWSQYKSAGAESYVGIWKQNKKVYNFDKITANIILNRYSEIHGRPLVQRALR